MRIPNPFRGALGAAAGSGLTFNTSTGKLDNNLITGKAGGQTVIGDTASGGNLTLQSTSHATRGKINLGGAGTHYFDEAGHRLNLGTSGNIYFAGAGGSATFGSPFSNSGICGDAGAMLLGVAGATMIDISGNRTKFNNGLRYRIRTETGTYGVALSDHTILADATGGAFDVTLPSAVTAGDGATFVVKRISAANTVTVKSGGGTIDGVAAGTGIALDAQYKTRAFRSDGTNWFITAAYL